MTKLIEQDILIDQPLPPSVSWDTLSDRPMSLKDISTTDADTLSTASSDAINAQASADTANAGLTDISIQGWTFNGTFSVSGNAKIVWTGGTLAFKDGTTFSIVAGSASAISTTVPTYIYFDKATSITVLQTSIVASLSVGINKVLIGTAQGNTDTTKDTIFQIFGGGGGVGTFIKADNIAAGTITANEIAVNTITANEMNITDLSAISANIGDITAGTFTLSAGGYIKSGQTAFDTGIGFYLGNDAGTQKLSVGNSTDYLKWDGTKLIYTGQSRITFKMATIFETATRFTLYNSVVFGSYGATITPSGPTITANRHSSLAVTISNASSLEVIDHTMFSCYLDYLYSATDTAATPGNNGAFYIGTNAGTFSGTTFDLTTTQQYGFKIIKTDGTVALFSTTSDGTAETITTLVPSITRGGYYAYLLLTAVSLPGQILFYINGSLVATHTTNLPPSNVNSQNWCTAFAVTNLNTAYDFKFNVSTLIFEKFSGLG